MYENRIVNGNLPPKIDYSKIIIDNEIKSLKGLFKNCTCLEEINIKISDDYIYLSNDIMCEFLGINYQIEKKNNK